MKDWKSLDDLWEENYQKCAEFKQEQKRFPKKGGRSKNE